MEQPQGIDSTAVEFEDASGGVQFQAFAPESDRPVHQATPAAVSSSNNSPTLYHGTTKIRSLSFSFSPAMSAAGHERTFLSSEHEVHLMRHWIDNVSHFFDYFDQERHFAFDVPQRAKNNEVLCVAILALAARHLNLTQGFSSYIADRYLERCVQLLIPQMTDSKAVADDAFFAAVVILRFLEELDVSVSGSDSEGHIVGTRAAMNAIQKQPVPLYGLRRACYWVAYRQEIQNSIITRRPLQWHLPDYNDLADPADDLTWALRANELLANAVDSIFVSPRPSLETLNNVQNNVAAWARNRPPSFDPLWIQPGPEGYFDRIYYHNTHHVMAHCYVLQAHMFVTAYSVSAEGFEGGTMDISAAVLDDINKICGMALANPQGAGAWERAALVIELFGDRYYMPQDRKNILRFLDEAERKCAWMTRDTKARLLHAWDMSRT